MNGAQSLSEVALAAPRVANNSDSLHVSPRTGPAQLLLEAHTPNVADVLSLERNVPVASRAVQRDRLGLARPSLEPQCRIATRPRVRFQSRKNLPANTFAPTTGHDEHSLDFADPGF
jgi:hypothetical protein